LTVGFAHAIITTIRQEAFSMDAIEKEGLSFPTERKAYFVLRSGDDWLVAMDSFGGQRSYYWFPWPEDAWRFDSLEEAEAAARSENDFGHPFGSVSVSMRISEAYGDPIGAKDRNGLEISLGDKVRAHEGDGGSWVAYVIGPHSLEGDGGFDDDPDWADCEILEEARP
jgi:hypothetical protein